MESKQTHFFCDKCEYTTSYKKDYSVHLLSKKHKLAVNSDTNNEVYNCECCSYQTPHKYNYNLDNIYNINDRIDYKHLKIYSIDPENCTDADDAFSIYKDDNYIHLIIHIADPTSWFNPNDELFNDIITFVVPS